MLRSIAGNIGLVLQIHRASIAMTDTSEALVCVDLDLQLPRKERIWIGSEEGGFWQSINYHRVPHLCSHCHKIGHLESQCKRKQRDRNLRLGADNIPVAGDQRIHQEFHPRAPPVQQNNEIQNNRFAPLAQASAIVENENPNRLAPSQGAASADLDNQLSSDLVINVPPGSVSTLENLGPSSNGCGSDTVGSTADFHSQIEHQLDSIQNQELCTGGSCSTSDEVIINAVSILSHKENVKMYRQENLSHGHDPPGQVASNEISVFPGLLFSDIRLTRAKAKKLAFQSSVNNNEF